MTIVNLFEDSDINLQFQNKLLYTLQATLLSHRQSQEVIQPACIQLSGRQKMGRTVFHKQGQLRYSEKLI